MVKKEDRKKPYLDREEKKQAKKSGDEQKITLAKGGLEEIDSLFEKKKRSKVESKMQNDKKKRRKVSTHVEREGRIQGEWTDDGLGGKFNAEGFTGRVEDGCKIFKAHVLNKPNFGYSKDCPFDCDCCFI